MRAMLRKGDMARAQASVGERERRLESKRWHLLLRQTAPSQNAGARAAAAAAWRGRMAVGNADPDKPQFFDAKKFHELDL